MTASPPISAAAPLTIAGAREQALPFVSRRIGAVDGWLAENPAHYFSTGASALELAAAAARLVELEPRRILDFGSGGGRVTRWLRALWPDAQVFACDADPAALSFCRDYLGARVFTSGASIAELAAPVGFDLIWAGGLLCHRAEPLAQQRLERLYAWLEPDGVLLTSLHGRHVAGNGEAANFYGLDPAVWAELLAEAEALGYGFRPYPGGTDEQGFALTGLAWIVRRLQELPGSRLLSYGERLWDQHHDVVALQKRPLQAPRRPDPELGMMPILA